MKTRLGKHASKKTFLFWGWQKILKIIYPVLTGSTFPVVAPENIDKGGMLLLAHFYTTSFYSYIFLARETQKNKKIHFKYIILF